MTGWRLETWGGMRVLPVMASPAEYGAHLRVRIQPLMTGIGPVEAAVVLTKALAELAVREETPALVLSLGSCGSPTLDHAAVYQASSVAYRDMDASPLGFERGVTPLLDMPAVVALPCPIQDVPTATLSTGGNVISGAAYDAIDADMVDMETWALMRACRTFEVPLVALRGVSDGRAELKVLTDWTSTLHHVDENLARAVDALIAILETRGPSALETHAVDGKDAARIAEPEPTP